MLVLPARNEGPRIARVLGRFPKQIDGHRVLALVVDDGSGDDTAALATAHGAIVVRHPTNLGLGAAVRTGFAEAVARGAVVVAFCDADGEYDPAELAHLARPILHGQADYVVGSRFSGKIHHMRPHRRFGNRVLTHLTRVVSRQSVTDGQSGYRALSGRAAAAASIIHDYNYAQVLTLDLVGKGFGYHEVPITYRFRESGTSFIRLGVYLRKVLPAIYRQLNAIPNTPTARPVAIAAPVAPPPSDSFATDRDARRPGPRRIPAVVRS